MCSWSSTRAPAETSRAREQAFDCFPGLKPSELPRYILVCDFRHFELLDLDTDEEVTFALRELPRMVEHFGLIMGVEKRVFRDQDPVNVEAAELMGMLYDALKESGYEGHPLERFLVRTLFCLFADDTGIFERRGTLEEYVETRTQDDGSDVGDKLNHLFQTLNTPEDRRQRTLDDSLAEFPYVNSDLFAEILPIAAFDGTMRQRLLEACRFNWEKISPAIFGALFQSVMSAKQRRAQGAHYTTEKNILKVNLVRSHAHVGFEATNSITQGEQVAQLWPLLFERYHLEIAFGHRTFAWGSDARGVAHVHVVILGLTRHDDTPAEKRLFSYADLTGEPTETLFAALSPYLFDATGLSDPHVVVREASRPPEGMPRMIIGSKPTDGGNYILSDAERSALLSAVPRAEPLVRPFVGADDFVSGKHRWILCFDGAAPAPAHVANAHGLADVHWWPHQERLPVLCRFSVQHNFRIQLPTGVAGSESLILRRKSSP